MFLFIYIIAGRFSFHIGENKRHFSVPFLFGFQAGGTYLIDVKNNVTDNFIFLIATEDDMDRYMTEQNLYYPCNVTIPIDYYNITELNNSSSKIIGSIKKTGKYNTTVLSCEYFHDEFSFELIYKNPNSCLSYTVQNILITNPIITLISIILFIIWIINWVKNFTMKNVIHTIFTFAFLFYVIQKIFFLLETIEKNKLDDQSHYQSYSKLFQRFSLTYMLTSFLTIENQFLFHIYEKVKIFIISLNLIFSYNLAECLIEAEYFDDDSGFDSDEFDYLTFIIIFLWEALLFFSTVLTYFLNVNNLKCCFTIQIFVISILYVIFYAFYSLENTFLFDDYIVVIIDIINIAFLSFLGFKFRLNSNTRNNYLCLQFDE